ncbi:MAG: hypothetical protein QM736_17070 [Vicinamibacterales bacterium]
MFRNGGSITTHPYPHSVAPRHGGVFSGETPFLDNAAAAVAAVTIVLYQAWFMPFFQPFFAGRTEFARVVFYTLYGSLLLVAAGVVGTRARVRRHAVQVGMAVAVGVAITLFHPLGAVTRAYIIALGMGGATIVAMLGSAPGALLRLTAAVTALNAVLCFVDLLFVDGFTTTAGRAAGLAGNPNVAAAAILLGAAASHRAVPNALRPSFLVLSAGALAVTLSRSTILAAVGAAAVPVAVEMWRRARTRRLMRPRADGVRPAAVLAAGLVAWVGVAAITNHHLRPVVHAVVTDSLSFVDALDEAHESIAVVVQNASPAVPAADVASVPEIADAPAGSDAPRIAALDERLTGEGRRNTIAARTLFLERAMLSYRNNGFFGIGLEKAHALVPHNTFVLFALAYGHPGWLVPIALAALALCAARDVRDVPLSIAVVGTMATSHDILVTPSLVLPIAIGIGGMLVREHEQDEPRVDRSVAAGAVIGVGLFVLGCLLIIRVAPPLTIERLNPTAIVAYRGAYLAYLPAQTFPGLFVPEIGTGPDASATFLREDSRHLVHVHGDAGGNPPVAAGEYAARENAVIFAPADDSDRDTNGRVLELGLPRKVGVSFYALVITLVAWCTSVVLWFGRHGSIGRVAVCAQEGLH